MKKHKSVHHQSGVLPYKNINGTLHVLLITTSSQKKWIIPKGNIEKNLTPPASALKEAEEEAGLKGIVTGESIGSYHFKKKSSGRKCKVEVFPMKVEQEIENFEEQDKRERCWCTIEEAVDKISNKELKEIIENAAVIIGSSIKK